MHKKGRRLKIHHHLRLLLQRHKNDHIPPRTRQPPLVKASKNILRQMNLFERRVVKNPKTNDADAATIYADALDLLDIYLDLVELPPTESGNYDKEFSTLLGQTSRIT